MLHSSFRRKSAPRFLSFLDPGFAGVTVRLSGTLFCGAVLRRAKHADVAAAFAQNLRGVVDERDDAGRVTLNGTAIDDQIYGVAQFFFDFLRAFQNVAIRVRRRWC